MGIPAVLVYLGFTGDGGIRDAGEPFADDAHWQEVFAQYAGGVGAMSQLEKRHELGGAPFWMAPLVEGPCRNRLAEQFLFPGATSRRSSSYVALRSCE